MCRQLPLLPNRAYPAAPARTAGGGAREAKIRPFERAPADFAVAQPAAKTTAGGCELAAASAVLVRPRGQVTVGVECLVSAWKRMATENVEVAIGGILPLAFLHLQSKTMGVAEVEAYLTSKLEQVPPIQP